MRGCECVLGVKESVYGANCIISARHTSNSKDMQSSLEAKKSMGVCVCSGSVLYCIGVCCRREKRESNNQRTHTHTLLHSRQISFEKLKRYSRILWNSRYLKIKMNYRFSANPACTVSSAHALNHSESRKTV
jgi:hypothetical protein